MLDGPAPTKEAPSASPNSISEKRSSKK
jgi:hypothetical protein